MIKYFTQIMTPSLLIFFSLFAHVSAAETFRVMLHTGAFPPYFFDEDDARTGTIRDIFSAITDETGDSIEYVRVPFKRSLRLFEIGDIDIEPMTNPIWRQSSPIKASYSIPFTVAEEVVLFREGYDLAVHTPEDLLGKTIGLIKGYHYPTYDAYFSDNRILSNRFKNENKLVELLAAGRLNQAFISKDFAQYQIKTQYTAKDLVVGDTIGVVEQMIRFHPAKKSAVARFNKAITKLKANGTIDRIYDQYR